MPADRPTFAELRSHFEGLLEGQHASDYIDFTASLAPITDQEKGRDSVTQNMAAEGNFSFYIKESQVAIP